MFFSCSVCACIGFHVEESVLLKLTGFTSESIRSLLSPAVRDSILIHHQSDTGHVGNSAANSLQHFFNEQIQQIVEEQDEHHHTGISCNNREQERKAVKFCSTHNLTLHFRWFVLF